MGVPKFYRWTSERYPCLSEIVKEYQIPDFDNLYLDMNGIIHTCSHPNDADPHFRITEEKIFVDIAHYIEALFRMIRPKKVFFMAVDGVAPRAKMNQQRGRRFRSAREAKDQEKEAIKRGEVLPETERFDSNCITPGTEFMVRLQAFLKFFVARKITTDPMWQKPRIYLSGHETPGEGEHKIMDFIRKEKSHPNHDPNTRHCLYGLDADLIMLGLCSHEPHFSLLREEVRFGKAANQKRIPTPEETTFHLLHLSLMREYIEHEFSALKTSLPFLFDVEKIIDDWVLMGFLVGNDFIPHLPYLHIHQEALPKLYEAYIDVLPKLGGYINEQGYLNLPRFEKFLERVKLFELETFSDVNSDNKWLASKKAGAELEKLQASPDGLQTSKVLKSPLRHQKLQADIILSESEGELDSMSDEEVERQEFVQHKRAYYVNKMGYENVTPEVLREQAEGYVRAIQWNLHYYYHGVCSWSWFYPHHYAPYITDITGVADLKLTYDYGRPFYPYEQLLAVLPSASKSFLPKPFQDLMTSQSSPILHYYPQDFETDLNGKQQDWEAVVLIPFIDEKVLLEAMHPLYEKLTQEEKRRNSHGPCLLYTYVPESQGVVKSPFPEIHPPEIGQCLAKWEEIQPESFRTDPKDLILGLCPDVKLDVYYPGFPTFKHIPHKPHLEKAHIQVFQHPSQRESMIIDILPPKESPNLLSLAIDLLGQCVYVGWPHLMEARVVAVSDRENKYMANPDDVREGNRFGPPYPSHKLTQDEQNIWDLQAETIKNESLNRRGKNIGETKILLEVLHYTGRNYVIKPGGHVRVEKCFSRMLHYYPLQTVVTSVTVKDLFEQEFHSVEDLYPPGSIAFYLGPERYGAMVEVLARDRDDYIIVKHYSTPEPDLDYIRSNHQQMGEQYFSSYIAAQRLGISQPLMSRITGSCFVATDEKSNAPGQRANIGLDLKFNKRNSEVHGYTRKIDDQWMYSSRTIDVVDKYCKKFPDMFDYLNANVSNDVFFVDKIFPKGDGKARLKQIKDFLKGLPSSGAQQYTCGTQILDENIVELIEKAVDEVKDQDVTTMEMSVPVSMLKRPLGDRNEVPMELKQKVRLLDRVVNIRGDHTVPLGSIGTIIGILTTPNDGTRTYEILFDRAFEGGIKIRSSPNRAYRMESNWMFVIHTSKRKPHAVVSPMAAKTAASPRKAMHGVTNNNINYSPSVAPFLPRRSAGAVPWAGYVDFPVATAQLPTETPLQPLYPATTVPLPTVMGPPPMSPFDYSHPPPAPYGASYIPAPPPPQPIWSTPPPVVPGYVNYSIYYPSLPAESPQFVVPSAPRTTLPRPGPLLPAPFVRPPPFSVVPSTSFASEASAVSTADSAYSHDGEDPIARVWRDMTNMSVKSRGAPGPTKKDNDNTNNKYISRVLQQQLGMITRPPSMENPRKEEQRSAEKSSKPEEKKAMEKSRSCDSIGIKTTEIQSQKIETNQASGFSNPDTPTTGPNFVTQLFSYVKENMEGPPPQYEYSTFGPMNQNMALLVLPDKKQFVGMSVISKEDAANNAARKALQSLSVPQAAYSPAAFGPPRSVAPLCSPSGGVPPSPRRVMQSPTGSYRMPSMSVAMPELVTSNLLPPVIPTPPKLEDTPTPKNKIDWGSWNKTPETNNYNEFPPLESKPDETVQSITNISEPNVENTKKLEETGNAASSETPKEPVNGRPPPKRERRLAIRFGPPPTAN